jgi:hypothetical protein
MAIAFLLQGALGGALLLVLLFAGVVAVVVAAGVFGGAVGGRGGSGGEDANQTQGLVPPGTILAGVGMGLAVIGALYPSLSFGFVGMALGAIAYYRGARILGGVVSVLSFIALFIGYFMGGEVYRF